MVEYGSPKALLGDLLCLIMKDKLDFKLGSVIPSKNAIGNSADSNIISSIEIANLKKILKKDLNKLWKYLQKKEK